MKILILGIIASFLALEVNAQSFYVVGKDDKSREYVKDKIRYEGYTVREDSSKADYTVSLLTDGSYKAMGMKRPYEGYIKITDNKSGEEVARTARKRPDRLRLMDTMHPIQFIQESVKSSYLKPFQNVGNRVI